MSIRTAIIASLFAFVLPGLAPVALATSGEGLKMTQFEQEELRNQTFNSDLNDARDSRRELFSEPFYQPETRPQRREKVLSEGTEGSQVTGLQQRLKAHGFTPGKIDSVYGPRTTAAVRDFQAAKDLAVTGEVDRTTWQALMENPQTATVTKPEDSNTLSKGARGTDVRALQERLEAKGYNPGPIDGIFGSRTLAALNEFQIANRLDVNSVVTEAAWQALTESTLPEETMIENSNSEPLTVEEETSEEAFNLDGFTN